MNLFEVKIRGVSVGELSGAELKHRVSYGKIGLQDTVRKVGQENWVKVADLPKLSILAPADIPLSASSGARVDSQESQIDQPKSTVVNAYPPQPFLNTPSQIDITATMWLSVVTFGIYGLVTFFKVMKTYERYFTAHLQHQSPENLNLWFWLYVSSGVLGGLLTPIGLPFTIASIVFGAILLNKVIRKRDAAFTELNDGDTRLPVQFKRASWHLLMWIFGIFFSILIIPIFLIIFQGIQFFREYNVFVIQLNKREV